jgi:hypothetical protein
METIIIVQGRMVHDLPADGADGFVIAKALSPKPARGGQWQSA